MKITRIRCDNCLEEVKAAPGDIAPHPWVSLYRYNESESQHFCDRYCFLEWAQKQLAVPTSAILREIVS